MPSRNPEREGTTLYTDKMLRRRLEELCCQWKIVSGDEISLVEIGKLFGEHAKIDLNSLKQPKMSL